MSLRSFFCWHEYKPVKVWHYSDTSYKLKVGLPSTAVTYHCSKCRKTKIEHLFGAGHLTLADLGVKRDQE